MNNNNNYFPRHSHAFDSIDTNAESALAAVVNPHLPPFLSLIVWRAEEVNKLLVKNLKEGVKGVLGLSETFQEH